MSLLHAEALLDHFRNPRNPGVLPPPALIVDVDNPACGDRLKLSAEVVMGAVVRAAFQAKGCTASIAAGSALTDWLVTRRLDNIAKTERGAIAAEIDTLLGGLIPETRHAAMLAEDAVRRLAELRA